MSTSDRLFLPSGPEEDIAWMRAEIAKRGLKDVTDHHLRLFWNYAEGDRKMAVEAIASIHRGKPYEPLRRLIERGKER